MCGAQARRLPSLAREVACEHEIGNHTDTHPRLWLRSGRFIEEEITRAQHSLTHVCGRSPRLFRPTYGVRWFGLRNTLSGLGLTSVTWTAIARDWLLPAPQIVRRISAQAANGAIFCFHDGRENAVSPDIENTIKSIKILIPFLQDRGWVFKTITNFSDTVVSV
jgi:peptidoglycan/xylan/chitin deacetylase (PgdA/CDA1 family)